MQRAGILVLVAVILAASFVMVANILSDTAKSIKNKGVVDVKGFAKQEIRSDLGILEAQIVAENPDIKACYESLSKDKEKVTAFLKRNFSLAEKDLELKPARIKSGNSWLTYLICPIPISRAGRNTGVERAGHGVPRLRQSKRLNSSQSEQTQIPEHNPRVNGHEAPGGYPCQCWIPPVYVPQDKCAHDRTDYF